MSSLHREYEELMQDLFQMYNSGTIDAPCDGTISGIDKDSPHLLAAESGEPVQADLLTAEEPYWEVVLLSNTITATPCNPNAEAECPEADWTKHDPACPKYCHNNGTCDGIGHHHPGCIQSCTSGTSCGANFHTTACIESCVPKNGICAKDPGYHKKSVSSPATT
jgi:hypothetical protein